MIIQQQALNENSRSRQPKYQWVTEKQAAANELQQQQE